jgi:hypothetical protein
MATEERFSGTMKCGHCGNTAPMRIIGAASNTQRHEEDDGLSWEAGTIYQVLLCPACDRVTLLGGHWNDGMDDPSEWSPTVLFPPEKGRVAGLPKQVGMEYEAAQKVASISPNACAVLLGRVLDCVCGDRGAKGSTLAEKLNDLAGREEIPKQLSDMAHKLRQLRNVGAHADLGALTKEEIPVLEALCRAVLEYVYAAPLLLKAVEERLGKIKEVAPKKANPARRGKE